MRVYLYVPIKSCIESTYEKAWASLTYIFP